MFRLASILLFSLGLCLPTFAQAPKKYALLIAVTTY